MVEKAGTMQGEAKQNGLKWFVSKANVEMNYFDISESQCVSGFLFYEKCSYCDYILI